MSYTSRTSAASAHVSLTRDPAGPAMPAQATASAGSLAWGERCRLRSTDANVRAPEHHPHQTAAAASAAPPTAAGPLAARLQRALSWFARQLRHPSGRGIPHRTVLTVVLGGAIVGTMALALSAGLIPGVIMAGVVIAGTVGAVLLAKTTAPGERGSDEAAGDRPAPTGDRAE